MRVFKYRGGGDEVFKRDLEGLKNDYFWAPTRDSLNDPCEGFYDRNVIDIQLEALRLILAKEKSSAIQAFQDLKLSLNTFLAFDSTAGIYSLSRTPTEELLWAHYGYSHKGFCIEYDLDTLVEFEKNDYRRIEVKYSDDIHVLSIADLFDNQQSVNVFEKILGIKSSSWKYEKEVRVITSQSGRHDYDFRAVKAVYFGLRMPNSHKQEVMHALKGRGIAYKQITLVNNSYKFNYVEVEDECKASEKYKYSVAPIAEHAISTEYIEDELKE